MTYKFGIGDFARIELYSACFCMTSVAGADCTVAWVACIATCVAHLGLDS